jgi:ubiquinone/menaquinone biosynthesis C-methylase UbiE
VDEIAAYNVDRWRALAEAGALYSRPALDLDAESARAMIERDGWSDDWIGPVAGKRILCLAGGGGQQSAAFAILGAQVTVADLSDAQLERDREVAAHYRLAIETVQADIRDLSAFDAASFDAVWHAYSLNFVPDAPAVFGQVARVLRPGGLYHLMCANPLVLALNPRTWDGTGYPLSQPYRDGESMTNQDEAWVYRNADPNRSPIPGPREYRHTLATLVNGLVERGFAIRRLSDGPSIWPDLNAEPGTWDHFVAIAPPWLTFLCLYEPR